MCPSARLLPGGGELTPAPGMCDAWHPTRISSTTGFRASLRTGLLRSFRSQTKLALLQVLQRSHPDLYFGRVSSDASTQAANLTMDPLARASILRRSLHLKCRVALACTPLTTRVHSWCLVHTKTAVLFLVAMGAGPSLTIWQTIMWSGVKASPQKSCDDCDECANKVMRVRERRLTCLTSWPSMAPGSLAMRAGSECLPPGFLHPLAATTHTKPVVPILDTRTICLRMHRPKLTFRPFLNRLYRT